MDLWTKQHRNIIGNIIMEMPVALKLKNMTVFKIFKSVREQVKGSLSHRDYSYILLDEKILKDDILCSTYQSGIETVPSKIDLLESMAVDLKQTVIVYQIILCIPIFGIKITDFLFSSIMLLISINLKQLINF